MLESSSSGGPSAPEPWRTRTSWGVEIGGLRLAVTHTREHGPAALGPVMPPVRRAPFAAGALAGMGVVALLVVGASAAPRPAAIDRYLVSVPIPAAAPAHVVRPARSTAIGRTSARTAAPLATITGDRFDPADEPYVARAMTTGALQEWADDTGMRRFLTAGPARVADGRACRDLALLIRLPDGGSHVRSAERCTTAPIVDAPEPAVADEQIDQQ